MKIGIIVAMESEKNMIASILEHKHEREEHKQTFIEGTLGAHQVVLLQSGKRSGLSGAISGAADTFMTKSKAKTWDARLAKMTKWVALAFVLLTLILNLI